MRLFTSGLSLALLSFCFLGLAGCGEDNEAAIKEQASKAKGTIPGSRTAQAQTQEEYFEITPGVQGAGMRVGPDRTKAPVIPARGSRWRSLLEGCSTVGWERSSLDRALFSARLRCRGPSLVVVFFRGHGP